MGKLALIGAILLGFHGHALGHHQRYWWPAQDTCTITTGTDRHGVWHATPFIQCSSSPAHYASAPPPPAAGAINPNNPQTWCGQVWCGAPSDPNQPQP